MRLAPAVLLAACAAEPLFHEDPGQRLVLQGDLALEGHHDAVVSLREVRGEVITSPFCTGTVVAERWVLTAAHCVDDRPPDEVQVAAGADGLDLDASAVAVASTAVHPDFDAATLAHDLALLELAAPSPAPVAALLSASQGLSGEDVGADVDLVGFGTREDGGSGERFHVVAPVAGVGDLTLEVDQADGSGACHGDSGGPAFVERGGAVFVGGVVSGGDEACAVFSVATRVDVHADWLASVMEGATAHTFEGQAVEGAYTLHAYTAQGPGLHTLTLSGPDGVDLDLYLASSTETGWRIRARSRGPGAFESIQADAPEAGSFLVGVRSVSGDGAYTVTVEAP